MVRPHVSLITNVNPSHLEGLSDLEGVRREKLSLFEATQAGGTLFINLDDPSLATYADKDRHRRVTFAMEIDADCMLRVVEDKGIEGSEIILSLSGEEIKARTHLLGRHNLYNVLAAAGLAHFMGVPGPRIAAGIESFEPFRGRFSPVRARKGYLVVDDAYNANPASMQWAIDTVSALPCAGRRVAILGGMKELGEKGEEYHRDLGRLLKKSGISLILLLGEETKAVFDEIGNGRARFFEDRSSLIDFASEQA